MRDRFLVGFLTCVLATQGLWAAATGRGRNNQLVLDADFRARAAQGTEVVQVSATVVAPDAPAADYRDEYLKQLAEYKAALENAKQICLASTGSVNDVLGGLDGLLGTGIGQIAGGGVGAVSGGVNTYLTGKTIEDEKKIAGLQTRVEQLRAELQTIETEGIEIIAREKQLQNDQRRAAGCPEI